MVGVERFELPTSWSQTRRATRLRYTPERAIIYLSAAKRSILRSSSGKISSSARLRLYDCTLSPKRGTGSDGIGEGSRSRSEGSSILQFVALDQRICGMIMNGFEIFRFHCISVYPLVPIEHCCDIPHCILDELGITVGLLGDILFV